MSDEYDEPDAQITAPELAPAGNDPDSEHGGALEDADGMGEGETPPASAAEGASQRPGKLNLRFSELTRQRNEAEIRAAEERGRRLALEDAMLRGLQREPPQEPAETPDPEPDPSQYRGGEFDPQYTKDWARWDNRQQAKALRDEIRREQETAVRDAELQSQFETGMAQFEDAMQFCEEQAEVTPNAAPTLRALATPPQQGGLGLPNHLVDLITEDERPHVIAEYLYNNPQEIAWFRDELRRGPAGQVAIADRIGQIKQHYALRAARTQRAPGSSPGMTSSSPHRMNGAIPGQVAIPPPVNGAGFPLPSTPNPVRTPISIGKPMRFWRGGVIGSIRERQAAGNRHVIPGARSATRNPVQIENSLLR